MRVKPVVWRLAIVVAISLFALGVGGTQQTSNAIFTFSATVPRVWDDAEIADVELPLADPAATPRHITADYYYRIPVRPIHKSYPVYAHGSEPRGYIEWLAQQEPEIVFDASKLKTEEDWIEAGEIVFDAPIFYNAVVRPPHIKDPEWYETTGVQVAKDGRLPYFRYVIREKGKVELGTVSCAMCHTRVMPDGTVIKGAQGNFPFDRAAVFNAAQSLPPERIRLLQRSLFGAPWVKPDPQADLERAPIEAIMQWHAAIPPGVVARQGSSGGCAA